MDGDSPGAPVWGHDVDVSVVLHVDAPDALGEGGAGGQQGQTTDQEQLHRARMNDE